MIPIKEIKATGEYSPDGKGIHYNKCNQSSSFKDFYVLLFVLGWKSLSSNESVFGNIKQSHSQYVPLVTLDKNGRETGKEWERTLNGLPTWKSTM